MFFTIIYLVWRIFFTIPFEYGIVSIVAGFALLIVEVLGMVEAFVHYANMYSVKGYDLPEVPLDMYPHVDVFIATYSEEPALLYKTINGCKYMDYPDKSKVHTENLNVQAHYLSYLPLLLHYLPCPDNLHPS